jgi:hypothetical protein
MNKKYFVEIDREQIKVKDWARQHQNLFPSYNFTNTQSETPTTEVIVRKLIEHNYTETVFENIVVYRRN